MMKHCLTYILFLCLALPQQLLGADNSNWCMLPADTLQQVKKEATAKGKRVKYKAENYGYDASKYAFQRRYRLPDKVQFSNRGIASHLFVSAGAGVENISTRGRYDYDPGYYYSVAVGKDIAKNHALSIAFRYGINGINGSEIELEKYALQLNHHFHMTRYFLGYNPQRFLDISSTLGVGYQHAEVWGNSTEDVYAMMGLRNTLRLSNNIHLALEPYIIFGGVGYNGMAKHETSKDYNLSYGIGLSLNYTLKNELTGVSPDEKTISDKHFMFVEGGIQAIDTDISFSQSLGSCMAVGYGTWLSRKFALQGAVGYSSCKWDEIKTAADLPAGHPEYSYMARVQYLFARAELVANLLSFPSNAGDNDNRFSLNVSGGYEYGFQWKYTTGLSQTSCTYGGFTGAVQVKLGLQEGKAVYLSPRLTLVNFAVPYNKPYDYIKKRYTDKRFDLALGLEFGLKRRPLKLDDHDGANADAGFIPSMHVSASIGGNRVLSRGGYNGDTDVNSNISVGYEYQPFKLLGVRAKLNYSTHNFARICGFTETLDGVKYNFEGLCALKYKMLKTSIDLKVDLSNMVHGYNPYRKWNTALYIGPVATHYLGVDGKVDSEELTLQGSSIKVLAKAPEGLYVGLNTAFACGYSITSQWSLFGEANVEIHKNKYLRDHDLDYNPVRVINLEFGVKYRIK